MQHKFIEGAYFTECAKCGRRSHWSSTLETCDGKRYDKEPIPTIAAASMLRDDLIAFDLWWVLRGLPKTTPTLDEYRAEFLSWSLKRSAIVPTT